MSSDTKDTHHSEDALHLEVIQNPSDKRLRLQGRIDFDHVYKNVVGPHGLWQCMIVLLAGISTPAISNFQIFGNAVPQHRCKMPEPIENLLVTSNFSITNETVKRNLNFNEIARLIGPWSSGFQQSIPDNGCNRFHFESSNDTDWQGLLFTLDTRNTSSLTIVPCGGDYVFQPYEYQYTSTITAEWKLVCEDSWKVPFTTSILMVGMMVGFIFGGFITDRLGRRKTMYYATIFECASGIAASFAPNYVTFNVLRAFTAAGVTTKVTATSVFFVEMTTASYRSVFSAGWTIYLQFGTRVAHAIITMYLQNWRYLNLVITVPSIIGVLGLILMPESPRWLASQLRDDETIAVLYQAYRVNNCFRRREDLMSLEDFRKAIGVKSLDQDQNAEAPTALKTSLPRKIWTVVRKPYQNCEIAKLSIISTLLFVGQLCCSFGLVFYARMVRNSIHIVAIVNASAALPATLISTIFYSKVKSRRKPLIFLYIVSAVVLLTGGFYAVFVQTESELPVLICGNLGLIFITAALNMISIFVPELFPSSIRSQGLGNASGLGRIGSILCSFVNQLDVEICHGLPLVIYGVVTMFQIGLICCLPDITGDNLKDTVEKKEQPKAELT